MITPPPLNFCDLIKKFMQVRDELRTKMFTTMTWCLWNRRNALHFGRPTQPLTNISAFAGALLQDFMASQISEIPRPRPSGFSSNNDYEAV